MMIEYYVEVDDLVAFNKHHFHHSPQMRKMQRVSYFLILSMTLWNSVGFIGGKLIIHPISLATGVTICFLVYPLFMNRLMRFNVKRLTAEGRNKGTLGRHKIVLDEIGLMETTRVNETRTTWHGVERVEENENYIFIYLSSSSAHVVPKRSFAHVTDSNEFIETAKTYHGRTIGLPQYCGAPSSLGVG